MILYDHPASSNCMKVRILLRQLELPFESVIVDLFTGETKRPSTSPATPTGACRCSSWTPASRSRSPARSCSTWRRARRTCRRPALARTRVYQWLMFEQNQVEANAAVARFMALTGPRASARRRCSPTAATAVGERSPPSRAR